MSLYDNLGDIIFQSKPKAQVEHNVNHQEPLDTLQRNEAQNLKSENCVVENDLYDRFKSRSINPEFPVLTTRLSLHHIIQQTDMAQDERFHRLKAGTGNSESNTVYVGNLRWWVTDQDLWNLFSQFGVIGCLKIHADKVNGKSKGYAYIQFEPSHPMAAVHACEKLEGYDLQDNGKLRVQICSKEKIKQNEFANSSTFANLKSAASRYSNHQKLSTQVSSNPQPTIVYPQKTVKRAKFKEVMCTNFLADGICRFGEMCSYKHGPNDNALIEPGIMMGTYVDSSVPYGALGQ